jgi:hypothetical protein
MDPMMTLLLNRYILTIRVPKKDESFLWWVDDGEFRYYHFFQFGVVEKSGGLTAVQLVIGPLLFSIAWLRPSHMVNPVHKFSVDHEIIGENEVGMPIGRVFAWCDCGAFVLGDEMAEILNQHYDAQHGVKRATH